MAWVCPRITFQHMSLLKHAFLPCCHAGQQAATLKSLAETFRIPVVVVNQVTAQVHVPASHAFQGDPGHRANRQQESHLTAALGTMWAHAVNTRLVLESVADVRYIKVCLVLASCACLQFHGGVQKSCRVGCSQAYTMDGLQHVYKLLCLLYLPATCVQLIALPPDVALLLSSATVATTMTGLDSHSVQRWILADTIVNMCKHLRYIATGDCVGIVCLSCNGAYIHATP